MPAGLRILVTLALKGVVEQVRPDLESAAGVPLQLEFAPTADLVRRIGQGEAVDAAVLSRAAIDDLIGRGVFEPGSGRDLAVSIIAAAVQAGSPHPDIDTLQALRDTLLSARSVGYSRTGISGAHFAKVLVQLGVDAAVNARARVLDGGFTATLLIDGSCDLAVQQLSELLVVPGIEIVGPLPEGAQLATVFAAGRHAGSRQAGATAALIECLASPRVLPVYRSRGLQPSTP